MSRIEKRVSSLVTGVIWLGISEILGRGSIVVGNIYIAKTLGPYAYGIFVLSQTIVQYFWFAMDAGTAQYGIRQVAQFPEQRSRIVGELFSMRVLFGISAYFALVGLTHTYVQSEDLKFSLYIGGLYLIAVSISLDWYIKGCEKFESLIYSSASIGIVFVVSIGLLVNNENDYLYAQFAWVFSYFAGAVVLLLVVRQVVKEKIGLRFNFSRYRLHLRQSIYFALSGIFLLVYHTAPLLVISYLLSQIELGVFSAPFRLIQSLGILGFLVVSGVFPRMSSVALAGSKNVFGEIKNISVVLLLMGIALSIVLNIFAELIVLKLFGEEYASAIPVFELLAVLPAIYFFRNLVGGFLHASGGQKYHAVSTFSAMCVSIVLSFFLIQRLGVMGAAFALIISEIFLATLFVAFSVKRKRI